MLDSERLRHDVVFFRDATKCCSAMQLAAVDGTTLRWGVARTPDHPGEVRLGHGAARRGSACHLQPHRCQRAPLGRGPGHPRWRAESPCGHIQARRRALPREDTAWWHAETDRVRNLWTNPDNRSPAMPLEMSGDGKPHVPDASREQRSNAPALRANTTASRGIYSCDCASATEMLHALPLSPTHTLRFRTTLVGVNVTCGAVRPGEQAQAYAKVKRCIG